MQKKTKKTWSIVGTVYGIIVVSTIMLIVILITVGSQYNGVKNATNNGTSILETFLALGPLAYVLGLRHGVDADHIAAIDNTTRKLMQEGKDSKFTGTFFSLGHSSVVILLTFFIIITSRFATKNISNFQNIGGIVGTLISGGFLYLIALLNFFILIDLWKHYKKAQAEGSINEEELNDALLKRGFMGRYFNKIFNLISNQYQMYIVGFLFGLGFDTASEVAVLAITATVAGVYLNIPLYMFMIFPFLFTVGMVLVDTTDGLFMTFAYQWAFDNPLKKLWYNISMTAISVIIAYVVGTLELLSLIIQELHLSGTWKVLAIFDSGDWSTIFGVTIIGTFAFCLIFSVFIYKFKISNSFKTSSNTD